MSNNKTAQLQEIADAIIKRGVCPELAQSATQLVPGSGNSDADIVFVGEAPGKNEDLQGVPFVGAAGKFLDSMLESIQMKRSDIFITNIVKYRPPNNRDPTPEEKAEFWPYLLAQIEVIKPRIIVTLGRHSMGYFLPGRIISQIHGQPKRITLSNNDKIVVLPLFHPAAALYNGSMRQTLERDFSEIPAIIQKISEVE